MDSFNSPTYGKLAYDQVIEKVASFIKEDQNFKYKIIVGTDSESRNKVGDFVTAIIVHRLGKGGNLLLAEKSDPQHSGNSRSYWERGPALN